MGLACDPKNECLVVFGSQYASDEKTYLYRYRTGKWEAHDLDPHPPGKKGKTYSTIPKMAYDSVNGICLCLTWDDQTGAHETWALEVSRLRWTKMNPIAEPEPSMSRGRNLAFSAEHNVFILETSPKEAKGTGAQVWTYRYKKATADKLPAAPADLEAATDRDKVTLTWKAADRAKGYRVYRASAAEPWKLDFARIAQTERTTFEDRDLTAGTEYFYTVRAIAADETEGPAGGRIRTTPRVAVRPVVSVLAAGKVEVSWNAHPAADAIGYNVYRGVVTVKTIKKGEPRPWRDNDPEYPEPTPVEVRDVTDVRKLNSKPLAGTTFTDEGVDLAKPGPEAKDYKYAVYAYVVRAVNRRGGESGPSPYALTIPSEPANVLNRENGSAAELKWDPNPEKGIVGYRVYKLDGTWDIVRLTADPIRETTFAHKSSGPTRYWVVAVDALGQEGQPSSPVWHGHRYEGFYEGEWHQ
jgi:fibronectin type 3 domain-containing protein